MLPKRKTFTAYDSDEDMLSTCSSDMDYDMEQETTSRPTHLMASAGAYSTPMLISKTPLLNGGMVIMEKK